MNKNRPATVIHFINAAHVIDHMFMLIFPAAVLGMTEAFSQDYAQLIGLSLGGFIAFGACSLPAGWLGDRWSRRQMMMLFFFGIGAASILTGLSTNPTMLMIGMTLVGVFAAIYHPVGTAMLVAYAQNRGREIGLNGMWGNLGVAFSALLTGFLVAHFGWRSAFILPGCVSLFVGVLFAWNVKDEPIPQRAHTAPKGHAGQRISMTIVFSVLALATATGGVVFNATTMTYPKLFQDRLHDLFASPQILGLIVSLAYAFGAVAQLTMGRLLDRYSLKWPFVILTLCQAPLLFGLAHIEGWPVILLGAGFMFVVFGQVTVNDAMVANFVAPQWQSRVFALRYFLSFGASAAAIPLIAFIEPRQGLGGLYVILAGIAALTFAAALIFPRTPAHQPVGQVV